MLSSCSAQKKKSSKILYKSDRYTLYSDRVVEGSNTTEILSPIHIRSNYKSSSDTGQSKREWKLGLDISHKPQYKSDQPIVDALFKMSTEEAILNIEKDSTFRTGALWSGVWTRDISYSIILAFAYHEPEVAKISLMKKVKRNRIIQDTGSGGSWPVSSDRMIWATAAWEIYKVTGDEAWLKTIYPIIKNSVDDDYLTLHNAKTGLYRGESSFLDWRIQTYPRWMDMADIYVSETLGTNIIHYKSNQIVAEISKVLGKPCEIYEERANLLKKAINSNLWMPEKGYYAQYLYGRPNLTQSPRFEALGEALSVIFNIADKEQSRKIIEKSPVTAYGATCIYPQIPGIKNYHNNAIWPFVQSYWNLAVAKSGNEKALVHGLASIYRPGAFFTTNYENLVATTGDYFGTEMNSHRMLWSMAGNLAMVNRVFMGISFYKDGIQFSPTIPKVYGGKRSLTNFKYRKAILDISVEGFGENISTIHLDGKPLENAFLPGSITGRHTITIKMDNRSFSKDDFKITPNHFSLPAPEASRENNSMVWKTIEGAKHYRIYRNGKYLENTFATQFAVETATTSEYKVSAVDNLGWESFTSEPVLITKEENVKIFQAEDFAGASKLPYAGYTGKGFVESTTSINPNVSFPITVEKEGTYLINFRYSNGSGSFEQENKCGVRSLYVNGTYVGTSVFPQRGENEWSNWGQSNAYYVKLNKGANKINLTFEDWNNNMNVTVNTMMLDHMKLVFVGD